MKTVCVCILLFVGFYCEQAATTPSPCSAGTYGNKEGMTSQGDCVDCPASGRCSIEFLSTDAALCVLKKTKSRLIFTSGKKHN